MSDPLQALAQNQLAQMQNVSSLGALGGALGYATSGLTSNNVWTSWPATNTFVVNVAPAAPTLPRPDPDTPEVAWLRRRVEEVCWQG